MNCLAFAAAFPGAAASVAGGLAAAMGGGAGVGISVALVSAAAFFLALEAKYRTLNLDGVVGGVLAGETEGMNRGYVAPR